MRAVIDAAREQRFRVLAELVCWRRLDDVPADPAESIPWAIGVARNLLANAQRAERRRDRGAGCPDPVAPR